MTWSVIYFSHNHFGYLPDRAEDYTSSNLDCYPGKLNFNHRVQSLLGYYPDGAGIVTLLMELPNNLGLFSI